MKYGIVLLCLISNPFDIMHSFVNKRCCGIFSNKKGEKIIIVIYITCSCMFWNVFIILLHLFVPSDMINHDLDLYRDVYEQLNCTLLWPKFGKRFLHNCTFLQNTNIWHYLIYFSYLPLHLFAISFLLPSSFNLSRFFSSISSSPPISNLYLINTIDIFDIEETQSAHLSLSKNVGKVVYLHLVVLY